MLNTARMHDASYFSLHRIPIDIASLDFNLAILTGTQKEIDSRKQAVANVHGSSLLGRGRGARGRASNRGRGSSTSRNASVPP